MANKSKLSLEWIDLAIDIEWGTLRAKQFGCGINKMLAVHGWQDNANSFDKIIPYLNEDLTVIALDLPGHGWSDHFASGFRYEVFSYVLAIRKFVQKLNWNSFIYIGHSIGGRIGILYASLYPKDIQAFIPIDSKVHIFSPEGTIIKYRNHINQYLEASERSKKNAPAYEKEKLIEKMMESSMDYDSAELLLKRGSNQVPGENKLVLTKDPRVKPDFISAIHYSFYIACARSMSCPMLIIFATHGRTATKSVPLTQMIDAYKKDCKLFQFEKIEGHHHLHMTNSSVVGPLICQFVQDVLQLAGSKL